MVSRTEGNKLILEVTSKGAVAYTYDVIGRRTTMTVAGQVPVTYQYDADSRLTQVAQGSLVVGIGYDAAGRRTSLTYPNGVTTTYTYDNASHITSITHNGPAGLIESLTYTYDAAGNRTSLSRANGTASLLPVTVATAAYDAANEQTQFGTATLTYDANGNLTNDGTNTYTWDARNRLVGIAGGVTANFVYDPLGRRASKTINGVTTSFLYDGNDIVQEFNGGAVTAIYLRSLTIDEPFIRQSVTNEFYHTDALGSTLVLSNTNGAPRTTYSYEAFGNTTATGTSSNPFQYTGRENDGTNLYYYRARYYSPTLQRFIREDLLQISGRSNSYLYVENNPLRFIDPWGLLPGIPEIPDNLDGVPSIVVATVYAEAANQNLQSKIAVANVIDNRFTDTSYEFRNLPTYSRVISQKNAFESFGNAQFLIALNVLSGRKSGERLDPRSRQALIDSYQAVWEVYNRILPDTTSGALYFYSPYIKQPSYLTRGLAAGTVMEVYPAGVNPSQFRFFKRVQ